MLGVRNGYKENRSAVITPHVAHTDASVQRVQNTHNIVDGNLVVHDHLHKYAKSRGGQNEGDGEENSSRQLGVVEDLLVKIGGIALK